jgi:predicted nucleotidyltransferase
MVDVERIRRVVTDVLDRNDSVRLGYLFGSVARGKIGPLSDIDVGVLFEGSSPIRELQGRVMDALCLALKTDRIDVVALNEAPDPLRYRVIRDGILVCSKDPKIQQRFESDVVRRYLDFKPLREMAFRVARKRLSGAA